MIDGAVRMVLSDDIIERRRAGEVLAIIEARLQNPASAGLAVGSAKWLAQPAMRLPYAYIVLASSAGADGDERRGGVAAVPSPNCADRTYRHRCVFGGQHADRAGPLVDVDIDAAKAGVRFIRERDRSFLARPDRGTPLPRSGRPPAGVASTVVVSNGHRPSRGCAVPEMLDHGAAGFVVDPVSVSGWREALRRILAEPAALPAMGQQCFQRLRRHYTVSAMTDAYVEAMKAVLYANV